MVQLPESVLVESGLSLDFALKEVKMNDLLGQLPILFAESRVSYALFGGTAINKAFLDQPRFSDDADFFVYGLDADKFDALLSGLDGFNVEKPRQIFRELFRWTLSYTDADFGLNGQIHLDANFNFKRPVTASQRIVLKSFLSGFGVLMALPRVDVLPLDTLVAMKLLALRSRFEGKDFYDLFRLLSQRPFSRSRIFAEARKYSQSLFDFQRFDESLIKRAPDFVRPADESVLKQADAYILKPHRPDWRALKKDLVRLLKTRIR